jgi:hypothetical protein
VLQCWKDSCFEIDALKVPDSMAKKTPPHGYGMKELK